MMSIKDCLVLCFALVGTVACHSQANATSKFLQAPTVAATPTPVMSPAPTGEAAVERKALTADEQQAALTQLLKALRAASASGSFRAQLDTEIDGEKDTLALEFVAPNRYRMKGENLEFLIVDKDGYLTFGDDKWQRAPRDEQNNRTTFDVGHAPIFWGARENDEVRQAISLTGAHAETVAGVALQVYEYELTNAFGRTGTGKLRAWVAADGRPRKIEMLSQYEGVRAKARLTWLEYDTPVVIAVPAAEKIKVR